MSVRNITDSFEAGVVDPSIWKDKQIEPHQIAFSKDTADGEKSIVITTTGNDRGAGCESRPCQRAELRLHGNLRPEYGQEVWYGFNFRVTGDIQPVGSNRTVIGQWKAPGDDSPFLAQRFDNGVFHITVQDGDKRMTVASAKGDPEALDEFQELVAEIASNSALGTATVNAERALADLKAFQRFKLGSSFSPESIPQIESLGMAVKALGTNKQDRVEQLFDEFNFIQELELYEGRPSIKIERNAPINLPDPKQGWVDMVYRVKGGRTDNIHGPIQQGEIDVWANGEHVVGLRGNIGYQLLTPPKSTKMYFKFGMYRNILPNTILFHFDRFRQGRTQADVV